MVAPALLNYQMAPRPGTIFGCLLPAPWVGVAAGLLLAFGPAAGFPDRFAPLVLALTHLLVLGMLAPVMIGALFQLMPVVGGQSVPGANRVSPFVAAFCCAIAVALSYGFFGSGRSPYLAAVLLALLFFAPVGTLLALCGRRITALDTTTYTLRHIGLALMLVAGLGISLAGQFAGLWQLDTMQLLGWHASWGLLGWIGTLVLGIASTTVPMFWQTIRPGPRWNRLFPWALWLPLTLQLIPLLSIYAQLLGALVCVLTAALSLHALCGARRRFDPAWILWLIAALSWLLAALATLLWLSNTHWPQLLKLPEGLWPAGSGGLAGLGWWIGVLAVVGGGVLPVNAMLGKIIPFLVFLHLRRQLPQGRRVPSMQQVLPPLQIRWQSRLVLLSLLLLMLAGGWPGFFRVAAGISFAASQAMLAVLLLKTVFRYRHELLSARPAAASDIHQKN